MKRLNAAPQSHGGWGNAGGVMPEAKRSADSHVRVSRTRRNRLES